MNRIILFLFIFFIPFLANAEKSVYERNDNITAIGLSDKENEILAREDACNNAKRELIGYAFGLGFKINQNMIRTLGALDYSQGVEVNSGNIVLRGASSEIETIGGTTKCTLTYPVSEANIERERLKSAKSFQQARFTDVGDVNQLSGAVLEIKTIPDNAEVFVDNQRYATTPIRIHGKISPGSHLIRIEHENYKTFEITKDIPSSGKIIIEEILKRATGKLLIVTEPVNGATIKIDGELIGESPTRELELISGQRARIEASHPEAESTTQTISLGKNEERTVVVKLQLKPSAFSIHVKPSGASIILDGKTTVSTDRWVSTNPGSHTIEVKMDGYEDYTTSFELRGGEKKTLSSIELRSISKEKQKHIRNGPTWSIGASIGYTGSPLRDVYPSYLTHFGFTTRYQFSRLFSSEFLALYSVGEQEYSDASLTARGTQLMLGFPVRISQVYNEKDSVEWLSIAPQAVFSNLTYNVTYDNDGSEAEKSYFQTGYGGSLIYSSYSKTNYKEMGTFWDLRLGITNFQNAKPLQGNMPLSFGITFGGTW